jgi:hypothetical protein
VLFFGGDTDLYGYCINNPLNYIDPWGLELKYKSLKEAAKIADKNPEVFIKAIKELAREHGILRKGDEDYKYLDIADNWCDIPVSVLNYSTGRLWADYVSVRGHPKHIYNKRFEGGYHIHLDKLGEPVKLHYDAYDAMTVGGFIQHVDMEVLDPLPDYAGP